MPVAQHHACESPCLHRASCHLNAGSSPADADVPLKEDVADLQAPADEKVETRNRDDGDNIDVVPTSRDEVEEQVGVGLSGCAIPAGCR